MTLKSCIGEALLLVGTWVLAPIACVLLLLASVLVGLLDIPTKPPARPWEKWRWW